MATAYQNMAAALKAGGHLPTDAAQFKQGEESTVGQDARRAFEQAAALQTAKTYGQGMPSNVDHLTTICQNLMQERAIDAHEEINLDGMQMQLASKFPIRGASNAGEEIERQAAANSRFEIAATTGSPKRTI